MKELRPNKDLMDSLRLDASTRNQLEDIYSKMHCLLNRPDLYTDGGDHTLQTVRGLEAAMQSLWGFYIDPNRWFYEFHLKGCTCPKEDNAELALARIPERVYDSKCPWHGSKGDTGDVQDKTERGSNP